MLAWLGPALGGATQSDPPLVVDELDFRDRLDRAEVRYGDRRCETWTGNRWTCGLRPWHWVGRYTGAVTHNHETQHRACIWAHPAGGKPLQIRFDAVPLGDALYGEAAILDVPREGGPVSLVVRVDERLVKTVRLHDRGKGWTAWRAPTKPGTGVVSFEISAGDPSWRHVCFTALVEPAS